MRDFIKAIKDQLSKTKNKVKAFIRKDGPKSKPWCVYSKSGRNMGCFPSKKKAQERLRQIEFFKHKGENHA